MKCARTIKGSMHEQELTSTDLHLLAQRKEFLREASKTVGTFSNRDHVGVEVVNPSLITIPRPETRGEARRERVSE